MKTLHAHKKIIIVAALLISVGLFAVPIAAGISPIIFNYPNDSGHFWARGHVNEDSTGYMGSDLYGFGHMNTPSGGSISSWQVSEIYYYDDDDEKFFSGNFIVDVPQDIGEPGYIVGGQISISFTSKVDRIPLIEGEPNAHIDFWGSFWFTGGTDQYENLRGSGIISGTIHLHSDPEAEPPKAIDEVPPYFDFALIGNWRT